MNLFVLYGFRIYRKLVGLKYRSGAGFYLVIGAQSAIVERFARL